ncbi:MAG: DUF4907 domain-containing protein [Bacteroidota bacterium]
MKQVLIAFTSFILIAFCFSCKSQQSSQVETKPDIVAGKTSEEPKETSKNKDTTKKDNPYKNAKIDIVTYKVDTLGWGYDILLWNSRYVHQPSIPALPGNRGFAEDSLARRAAEFIVKKIRNNIIPPSVTIQELDSLGVLK